MTFESLINRRFCQVKECGRMKWRPYSFRFCPEHFIENGKERGVLSWVRDRFHGVINGSTAHLGPVDWGPGTYSRDELVDLYEDLPYARIDSVREAQWNNAGAREAAKESLSGRRRASFSTVQQEVARINETGM